MSTEHASTNSSTTDLIKSFDQVSGISTPVEVRLATKTMSIKQLAELTVGDTVSLDGPLTGTLDLIVGNVRLGTVEVIRSEAGVYGRIASLDVRDLR